MNEFLDVARTIYDALKIGIKENPLTGIGVAVALLGLVMYPFLMLFNLPKALEQRNWSEEEMLKENERGLSSRTGRALLFILAAILFSMAWAVKGLYLLMVPLALTGAGALYMALRPAAGAAWFTPAPAGKGSPWLSYAVALLLLMVSGWQFHLYLKASYAEKHWPHAAGIVRDTGVSKAPSGGRGGGDVYTLHAAYSYDVDGVTYNSRQTEVDMEAIYTDKQSALEALHSLYPRGGPVTVYYDPGDPADSTLGKAATGGLLFPVIFLLAALAAFINGHYRARERIPSEAQKT